MLAHPLGVLRSLCMMHLPMLQLTQETVHCGRWTGLRQLPKVQEATALWLQRGQCSAKCTTHAQG